MAVMNQKFEFIIQPKIKNCAEFAPTPESINNEVTVIIVPLRIKWQNESDVCISWSCNYGKHCFNELCLYSKGRQNK
jgi:hypothetical protein